MSELPTPETDYEQKIDNGDTVPLLEFARRLERQRDEARELARELLAEMQRLSQWRFPGYDGDCGIIAEIDSVISEFESKEVLP